MDLLAEDEQIGETGLVNLATPILCRSSTDFVVGQWQEGEFGRLAPDRERARVLKELEKTAHYTEEFTSQRELNSCLVHVSHVSESPADVEPHPGRQGHRLPI
jgi:hypothetical protein